jgi:hypothetical protein
MKLASSYDDDNHVSDVELFLLQAAGQQEHLVSVSTAQNVL